MVNKPPEPKRFRITTDPLGGYVLVDESNGDVLRTDTDPEQLAKWAFWEADAYSVEHAYDLRAAENARNAGYAAAWAKRSH